VETPAMTFEYWLGLIVTVLIAAFLAYALLRPEKF
jgi:K+-transporting ATPase KdpF subunit